MNYSLTFIILINNPEQTRQCQTRNTYYDVKENVFIHLGRLLSSFYVLETLC